MTERHKHVLFTMRVGDPGGGYRWLCATCRMIGGPPYATGGEAQRAIESMLRGAHKAELRREALRGTGLL